MIVLAKVNNLGADCYVRAKAILEKDNQDISNSIQEISANWKRQGEYYYYKDEVESKSMIEIFRFIKIPENVTNTEEEIELRVIVEAIQARNFEQDLEKEDLA